MQPSRTKQFLKRLLAYFNYRLKFLVKRNAPQKLAQLAQENPNAILLPDYRERDDVTGLIVMASDVTGRRTHWREWLGMRWRGRSGNKGRMNQIPFRSGILSIDSQLDVLS